MAIEIVDFPINKWWIFPWQNVSSPECNALDGNVSLFEQCQANTMNKPQRSAEIWGKHLQQSPEMCLEKSDIDSSLVTEKRT